MLGDMGDKIPALLVMLQYNKFHDLLKAVINKKISNILLQEYGDTQPSFSTADEFKIVKAVQRFSILQLIQLKGSNLHSVKDCYNILLQQMIRRKLAAAEINVEARTSYWLQLTDIFARPNFYSTLKNLEIANDFVIVIEKDILRTYKNEEIRAKSREVLQIFCHYNPYVGYCQGMNQIVAFIVSKGYTCQQSFFIFKRITEELLPCEFYTNMETIMVYTRIFFQLLNVTYPDVYHHLKRISEDTDSTYAMMVSYVLQWFVCLFCNDNVYEKITEVIWDFFLLDGIIVLFKAALAMIDLLKPHIMQCNDFESYNIMQKEKIKSIKDAQFIRKKIIQTYISPKIMFLLKQKLIQPQSEIKIRQQQSRKISYKKSCKPNLNVCLQALEKNMQQNKNYDVFVFRQKDDIKILPNYLQTLQKQYFKLNKPVKQLDELMIGRISHVCRSQQDTVTEDSISDKTNQILLNTPTKNQNSTSKSTPKSFDESSKQKQREYGIRQKVCKKIVKMAGQKSGMVRSESVAFMQQMVMNASISNLLEIYDLDQLFQ